MKRYGISSWIANNLPVDEAIQALAAPGFEKIEISGSGSPLLQLWEDNPVSACQKLKSAGLSILSIHGPIAGRRLDHADEATRQESIAANLEYFDKMRNCGIPEIVIHPIGSGDYSTQEKHIESRTRSLNSLKVLAEHAEQMGVRMAVENLSGNRPGSTLADMLKMIDGLGDHVGICFDIGHAVQAGLDIIHELKTAVSAKKLFSLHIHDVNEKGKDHFVPGEGKINWDAFISELDACDFHGGRILEISPPETEVAQRVRKTAEFAAKYSGKE